MQKIRTNGRSVDQFNLDGSYVASFINLQDARTSVGANNTSSISKAARGELTHAHGYLWKYTDITELPGEIWKTHPTKNVVVSNYGRCKDSYGRISKGHKRFDGYHSYKTNSSNTLVHRLVLETFNPTEVKNLQVDHIDRNKSNNCLNNLRWATAIEQAKNRKPHEKFKKHCRTCCCNNKE